MKRRNFISLLAGLAAAIPFLGKFLKRKPMRDYQGDLIRVTCDYHGRLISQDIPYPQFFKYTNNREFKELTEKEKDTVFWYFKNKYNNRSIPWEDYKRG